MKISISDQYSHNYEPVETNTMDELIRYITNGKRYSCGVFKDGHRRNANFMVAESIGLDIDNGENEAKMTLLEAKEIFTDYKHIIVPSKSHGKEKNGLVADRFRVILFLDKPITDPKDFVATWLTLKDKFPAIDDACKDAARYWEPSPHGVYARSDEGYLVEKKTYVAPEASERIQTTRKGKLSQSTQNFLIFGQENGVWNKRLFMAAKDMQEQNYTLEETESLLQRAASTELGNVGDLDENDIKTIASAFNNEPKYGARSISDLFNFKNIEELYRTKSKVDWLVDGILTAGGVSLLVGQPKSGKSTITRQLTMSVMRGQPFFGREVKKGKVLYLALEEQEEILNEQFQTLGINKDDDMIIHVGGVFGDKVIEELKSAIEHYSPSLVIIDTLLLFTTCNPNDYREVNTELAKIRAVARETNSHICAIHHQNKREDKGTESILGSNAIHGAVDCAILLNKKGRKRIMNSSQRGGKPFIGQIIEYNPDTELYTLSEENDAF